MATGRKIETLALDKFIATENTSAGPRWKKYLLRFDNMMEAYEISDNKRKKALLLHHSGEDVFDIYCTFENHKDLNYEETTEKLTSYFNPKKCPEFEIHKFRKCSQQDNESIDEFHTRLLALAENCEFENKNKEIKMQIIHKCSSNKLRKRALQQSMSLEELLALERSMEISSVRAQEMTMKKEKVYKLEKVTSSSKKPTTKKTCFRCGKAWPHDGQCPAMGKKCSNCSKMNHFGVACRSKRVNCNVEEDEESTEKDETSSDAESI